MYKEWNSKFWKSSWRKMGPYKPKVKLLSAGQIPPAACFLSGLRLIVLYMENYKINNITRCNLTSDTAGQKFLMEKSHPGVKRASRYLGYHVWVFIDWYYRSWMRVLQMLSPREVSSEVGWQCSLERPVRTLNLEVKLLGKQ